MAPQRSRGIRRIRSFVGLSGMVLLAAFVAPAPAFAEEDPRVGLAPGYFPWTEASSNIELLDNDPRVPPFDAPPGNFGFVNSDLAFTGHHAIVGSFNGFQIYDISDPTNPALRSSFVCPGGQGDPSVYGDLLFMSVEQTSARIDCGGDPITDPATQRFRGVRIFDISDLDNPVQLPGVQTCRGSHTHTIVTSRRDRKNIYLYNSGTAGVRSATELAGCENAALTKEPVTTGNPTQWRIDVIKVPLRHPERAAVVSQPRIFTDPATGAFNGLQNTLPGELHPSGTPYSPLPNTNTCHDVTSFPARELVAGACQGNGVLLSTKDPVNPTRLDAVSDPNFSYWHSATFNNDGSKVMFTDEWGGGVSARCRDTDRPEWGADALFDIKRKQLEFASYYKMPAVQTVNENCVAHNSSIIPVPGRDIWVQAWYQGGLSVVDFSDTANPVEIAYYDRGPINSPFPIPDPTNPNRINLGGFWSTYWYNGYVYGTEIARGFDTFGLLSSEFLSEDEIAAASQVEQDQFNAQHQFPLTWRPSFEVVGAYFDQAVRSGALAGRTLDKVEAAIQEAERLSEAGRDRAAAKELRTGSRHLRGFGDQGELKHAMHDLARALR